MPPTETQGIQSIQSWSAEEESIIATIQQTESVPRAEAIRRMQRRKKSSTPLVGRSAAPITQRSCRNPRCTRGEDGSPGSLAHLRADALYCGATCKKAVQRGARRQNQPSNRQCLCGSKRGQNDSLRSPSADDEHAS